MVVRVAHLMLGPEVVIRGLFTLTPEVRGSGDTPVRDWFSYLEYYNVQG